MILAKLVIAIAKMMNNKSVAIDGMYTRLAP